MNHPEHEPKTKDPADLLEARITSILDNLGKQGSPEFINREVLNIFESQLFQNFSKEQQLKLCKHLGKLGPVGEKFFIENLAGKILGVQGLRDRTQGFKLFQEHIRENPETKVVHNFEAGLFLNEQGQMNLNLLKFARALQKHNQVKNVLLMPSIADLTRTELASQILAQGLEYCILEDLDLYDEIVIGCQVRGHNEENFEALKKKLFKKCTEIAQSRIQELESTEKQRESEKITQALFAKIKIIPVNEQLVTDKQGEPIPGLGIGASGKSENLQTVRLALLEKLKQEQSSQYKDIHIMETDDDYVMSNVNLNYAFHTVFGALKGIKNQDQLEEALNSIQPALNIEVPFDTILALWQGFHGKALARTGGHREKLSEEISNQFKTKRADFSQLLQTMAAKGQESANDLVEILEQLQKNGVQLMPEHLIPPEQNPDALTHEQKFIIAALKKHKIKQPIKLLQEAAKVYLKNSQGPGGRVTRQIKQEFHDPPWRELSLQDLSYPLLGDKSYSLKEFLEHFPAAIGYLMETSEDIDAAIGYLMETSEDTDADTGYSEMPGLVFGIADFSGYIHSHLPQKSASIWGKKGMAPMIFQFIQLKQLELQGTQAIDELLSKLRFDHDSMEVEMKVPTGKRDRHDRIIWDHRPIYIKKMYLPGPDQAKIQKIEPFLAKLLQSINEGIHKGSTLLFYNPFDFQLEQETEPKAEFLPHRTSNPRLIPVATIDKSLTQVDLQIKKASNTPPVMIIENGCKIVLEMPFLQSFSGLDQERIINSINNMLQRLIQPEDAKRDSQGPVNNDDYRPKQTGIDNRLIISLPPSDDHRDRAREILIKLLQELNKDNRIQILQVPSSGASQSTGIDPGLLYKILCIKINKSLDEV
ncbi:MAG: hypothetical protein GF332_01920 [Candidatus Moranbacteria bacterium]|nr:hypothetical protein [Candidatus Moranbacteria bacterium]